MKKHTTQELINKKAELEAKADKAAAMMADFKTENDIEMFRNAKDIYESTYEVIWRINEELRMRKEA